MPLIMWESIGNHGSRAESDAALQGHDTLNFSLIQMCMSVGFVADDGRALLLESAGTSIFASWSGPA